MIVFRCLKKIPQILMTVLMTSFLSVVIAVDQSAPTAPPPAWKDSQLSFGFSNDSGNTVGSSVNGGVNLKYTKNIWQTLFNATGNSETSDREMTKEVYFVGLQQRYVISKTDFAFAKVNDTFDRFSAYDYTLLTAVGLGKNLYSSDQIDLIGQAGPGTRHARISVNGLVEEEFVFDSALDFVWNITPSTKFQQQVEVDAGADNVVTHLKTSLVSLIQGHFAIQLSNDFSNNSRLPEESQETSRTDNSFNVALVYKI